MELTSNRKEIINLLEELEVINLSKEYSYYRYKSWGIGQFMGWIEHKNTELLSNRLFGRILGVAIDSDGKVDGRYLDGANFINSLANGTVFRYPMGATFNVWELFGEEKVHITTESSQEEKDACELRTLKRLLNFIDKLEEGGK